MQYQNVYNTICYKNNFLKIILKFMNVFYYIVFAVFLYVGFISTTMRVVVWPDNMQYNMQHALWWIVGIKFFFNLLNGDIDFFKIFFITCVLIAGIVCYKTTSGYEIVLDVAVLVVGAINVDFKKILKLYFVICILITIQIMIQSKTGVVDDLIYYRNGHIRDSFGFIYPTDFAAHIFYIICDWLLIRREKCENPEIIIMLILALFLQTLCEARCSVLCIVLLASFVYFIKLKKTISYKKIHYNDNNKKNYIFVLVPLFFSCVIIFLGKSKTQNSIVQILNKILSGRINLTREAFENYTVKLWGQYVYMNGNGGSIIEKNNYFYIDSSYVNILLRFGLFVFLMVMIGISIIIIKNSNNFFIIGIILIICLHSLIEHHLFEYYYNFFIILPLACFDTTNNTNDRSIFSCCQFYTL